jgi:hypothetical protein
MQLLHRRNERKLQKFPSGQSSLENDRLIATINRTAQFSSENDMALQSERNTATITVKTDYSNNYCQNAL